MEFIGQKVNHHDLMILYMLDYFNMNVALTTFFQISSFNGIRGLFFTEVAVGYN